MYKKYFKRILDLILSLLAIVFLSPIFVVISVLIKLTSKGPVLFKQRRIGQYKKEFYILKFRTMKTNAPKDMPTHLLKDPKSHLTAIGGFLRKSSLDELPQIINIIKGDMSIIGPRPALWNQYDLIAERDKYGANDVPVGLTGLAQVNGRDELTIEAKARFDGEYAKRVRFREDLDIFFSTINKVFQNENV